MSPYNLDLQLEFVLQELERRTQIDKIPTKWKTVKQKRIAVAWKPVFVCDKTYNGESSLDGLKQCSDVDSATRFVEEQFERPKNPAASLDGRSQYAVRISEYCQSAECR